MSLPPEVLKKVKLLEISTRRLVNNLFAGEFQSAFKGQGMTFSEFREYVPGDDVRTISWTVTARTGKTFIKKFSEEREMSLMLLVDVSGSSDFGTRGHAKGQVMAYLAALLAFSATRNKDPVGLILFSDQVELFVPPKKGTGHVHRILRELLYFQPRSRKTNLASVLEFASGVLKKKSNVFIFSDFLNDKFDRPLRMLSRKHDTTAVLIDDPFEKEFQDIGLMDFEDAESGDILTVDTSSKAFRHAYQKHFARVGAARAQELKRSQVEIVEVSTDKDFVMPLVLYFKRRNKR